MDYQQAWDYLDSLQFFKIKLGLDSMAEFLASVGNPQDDLSFVHVAGTNGKGSVSMNLLTLLSAAGYRVGLYTSPHLSSVRERFRLGHDFISEEDFATVASQIHQVLAGRQITYFEFTTALALLWFAQQKVDLAILEVGMGGRLDATNVVTPLVSVITNVSMDHEIYLGDTLTKVAGEKAGIIKAGIPLVTAVAADESREVVLATAAERQAPTWLLARDFAVVPEQGRRWTYQGVEWNIPGLQCGMKGDYQQSNSALALAVLECLAEHGYGVDDELIGQVLPTVRWPGRLEYICHDEQLHVLAEGESCHYRYLLDGAHNPAGLASLVHALQHEYDYKRLVCVWAAMADKDLSTGLALMAPLCDELIVTRPESERSASAEQLQHALPTTFAGQLSSTPDVAGALELARQKVGPDDLVLVAGSLYLVGAARQLLAGDLVDG